MKGLIFDIDGVVVDSPHESAWGDALQRLMETKWHDIAGTTEYDSEKYNSEVYLNNVAGKVRSDGASSLLKYFNIPDPDKSRANELCDFKQAMIVELIDNGKFNAYSDALKLMLYAKNAGLKLAAASSSKNANNMLSKVSVDKFCQENNLSYAFVTPQLMLIDLFDANLCGVDFKQGKPHPEIFLTSAQALGLTPADCAVIEDAPAGVKAAKSGGMRCIGIARHNDDEALSKMGADWVLNTLDDVLANPKIKSQVLE